MTSGKFATVGKHEPVLSVRGLTTSFLVDGAWKPVVDDVSFDVHPGETVAIVGESGSGKSVTSLSIMRLLQKDTSRIEGSISLASRELLTLSENEMRRIRGNEIAMIFQEPMTSLNPLFTIGDQISEALLCHSQMSKADARAETVRLLEKVRIPSAASRFDEYPHRFSGGMRQRVMIAMALASRPKLLIADEPTTALDVTIQGQILDLIKTLQEEEGTSVLFITHDMGVVAEISDRTVVMFRGKQVETGQTADIFRQSKHPYTRALLSAVPVLGSMQGYQRPLRFPIVDDATGLAEKPVEVADTVDNVDVPVLEVKGLTKRFEIYSGFMSRLSGRVHAVENVSFTLRKGGETLSLVGESGCGKSTTGRAIMRLTEPDSGEVLVEGQNILSLGRQSMREMRRTVQMIFQDPYASLNPRMTVGAAIAEPYIEHRLGSARDAKNVVADMLEKVGLTPDMAKRYPHEFSGGQRQRICIARALALKPKVIVADESVSALDVSIKAQVINLMLDLQESLDLAFLFISHDMAVVERVSHRVAVMYLGEIVEIGPRSSVFENPQHDYTRKLMAAVPILTLTDARPGFQAKGGENSRALFGPRILSCLCVNIARFRRSTSWRCGGARDLTSGLMIDPALPQLRQQQRTPMGGWRRAGR
ncbi:microcin C ABC transporter ATP-binding protein YejF [Brucella intermedia 229E]|uniref:Glutathione import ATP-binding protein GsiA n=1 Tax=Brucella intermedia 229E TaxID=1337887 RepID=U4VDE7_9HYPH|nr:microcin C ABC transporter ATP-binding protein YejF [Brucella intermedia 229E]